MTSIDHELWAKKILSFLVKHVINFKKGYKYITYSDLADLLNYPEPHTGNLFSSNIGTTLGAMGHLFDKIVADGHFTSIPLIQSLVVSKTDSLPSDGLKEFDPTYPYLSKEKKRDFIKNEYDKIFNFGNGWIKVCKLLNVELDDDLENYSKKIYNPFGSEGSPEHKKLRDYVSNNPSVVKVFNCEKGIIEYPLKSGDSIDVLFEDDNIFTAIVVKSKRSGYDDIERGIYQCIKYRSVLIAENKISKSSKPVHAILVTEESIPNDLKNIADVLGITLYENITPDK